MKVSNMIINYIFCFFVDKLNKIVYYKIEVTTQHN